MVDSWTYINLIASALVGLSYYSYHKREGLLEVYRRLRLFLSFIPYSHMLFMDDKSTFKTRSNRKSALITYERNGICSKVHVPLQRDPRLIGHRAYLVSADHQLEITQQPDVPYLVTAEQLGGDQIQIHLTDQVLTFHGSQPVVLPVDLPVCPTPSVSFGEVPVMPQ
jgi:hypothetical protein